MAPPPAASRCRAPCLQVRNWPVRLVVMSRSQIRPVETVDAIVLAEELDAGVRHDDVEAAPARGSGVDRRGDLVLDRAVGGERRAPRRRPLRSPRRRPRAARASWRRARRARLPPRAARPSRSRSRRSRPSPPHAFRQTVRAESWSRLNSLAFAISCRMFLDQHIAGWNAGKVQRSQRNAAGWLVLLPARS